MTKSQIEKFAVGYSSYSTDCVEEVLKVTNFDEDVTCLGIFRGYDENYRDKLLKKCEKCKYHRVSKNMEA